MGQNCIINRGTFYYQLWQVLLKNWDNFVLLQIGAAIFITNWDNCYCKLGQLGYYKSGQVLLQIRATVIINWGNYDKLGHNKSIQEGLFSRKKKSQIHPTISLNNIQVVIASHHKYLGVFLYEKLIFKHIDTTILKINKGISVIKKLRHSLQRKYLMTIYKAFLRPIIDYGDIVYEEP